MSRPETSWRDRAGCAGADPELFFPVGPADEAAIAAAKAVCVWCPVRADCLEYATAHFLKGVWGGQTEDERRNYRRRQLKGARKQPA